MVVEGDISTCSIQHVLQEAEVAAEVPMVDEIMQVDVAMEHLNYQSHHITYTADDSTGVTRFAGVQHEVNHTSKTQLQGWKDVIHEMCTMYNECMVGATAGVTDPRELVTKVKGMLTDHAEDQKKLIHLFREWKEVYEREVLQKGLLQLQEELKGGKHRPPKSKIDTHLKLAISFKIGQEQFSALTLPEKESVDFFIWAGCCMHKDLNAVKGGNTCMQAWWGHNGVDGPVLLMNCDNAAATSGGLFTAQAYAVHVSQGGAAKALALAGSVFRHKDDKKGQ
ncbi:hypothetical protein BD769DRAFT_1668415 [Suillus cothurnatus]|nr:hypothetical protein BD769DRAFT_1668415 [Suillus cothurnatus]